MEDLAGKTKVVVGIMFVGLVTFVPAFVSHMLRRTERKREHRCVRDALSAVDQTKERLEQERRNASRKLESISSDLCKIIGHELGENDAMIGGAILAKSQLDGFTVEKTAAHEDYLDWLSRVIRGDVQAIRELERLCLDLALVGEPVLADNKYATVTRMIAYDAMLVLPYFDQLCYLEGQDLQTILRRVDRRQLSLALMGAKEETRDLFFRNMSKRLEAVIREDMNYMEPPRDSEMNVARRDICLCAFQAFLDGKICVNPKTT